MVVLDLNLAVSENEGGGSSREIDPKSVGHEDFPRDNVFQSSSESS